MNILRNRYSTNEIDFRRHIRPFFLTATGQPTAQKPYYDLVTWLTTQITLTFAILPFIYLTFPASLSVWASVYYYGIVGTLSSLVIFAVPGVKPYLSRSLAAKNGQNPVRNPKAGSTSGAGGNVKSDDDTNTKGEESDRDHNQTLGLPNDPGKELDEAVKELRADIDEVRRRK